MPITIGTKQERAMAVYEAIIAAKEGDVITVRANSMEKEVVIFTAPYASYTPKQRT